jgi:hypothetical protein
MLQGDPAHILPLLATKAGIAALRRDPVAFFNASHPNNSKSNEQVRRKLADPNWKPGFWTFRDPTASARGIMAALRLSRNRLAHAIKCYRTSHLEKRIRDFNIRTMARQTSQALSMLPSESAQDRLPRL